MSDQNSSVPMWVFVMALTVQALACFVVALTTWEIGFNSVRDNAIQAGAAEWYCDPKTGEKSFRWLPREPVVQDEVN